ncbi:hypothetical protein M0R45_025490 [Rubus argutus]|uniref:Uncharacterized protein n=1 Tax=Rubus argutus TaxID=59490 RepID=A0AAW1WXC3_RUBAR
MIVGIMNEIHKKESRKHGGTSSSRRYIPRDREAGHLQLMADYFNPGCLFPTEKFHRRFRMSHSLFDRILDGVTHANNYFQQRPDCIDERPPVEVFIQNGPKSSIRRNKDDEYEALPDAEPINQLPVELHGFLARHTQSRSSRRHMELKDDLINQLWNQRGND